MVSVDAFIAANRFGLGARLGELSAINGDPRGWLRAQIRAAPEIPEELQSLEPSNKTLMRLFAARRKGPGAVQAEFKATFLSRQRDEIEARALESVSKVMRLGPICGRGA